MSVAVPALLPASRIEFEAGLTRVLASDLVARVQIDVVDGKVAAPASWPYNAPGELERLRDAGYVLPRAGAVEYEIDLMALDALDAAGLWLSLGATRLTFHIESLASDPALLEKVHARYGAIGIACGLAVNTTTELAPFTHVAPCISYLQCMGIARIGRQGEAFDPRALDQIQRLRRAFPGVPIQVDGGVTLAHARTILATGASTLIVGSAILKAADVRAAMASFEALQNPFGV